MRLTGTLQLGRRVITAPTVGPFIALLLTMAFFSLKTDRFFQAQNFSLVLQQVMIVGVLAIGQTLVILTAGIDLSVGTVMALGQVVMTKLAVESGVPVLPALLLAGGGVSRFPFAGTTILIAVGVALETMKQIDSQLMMRNYEGFLNS